jgi:hypothetical protein
LVTNKFSSSFKFFITLARGFACSQNITAPFKPSRRYPCFPGTMKKRHLRRFLLCPGEDLVTLMDFSFILRIYKNLIRSTPFLQPLPRKTFLRLAPGTKKRLSRRFFIVPGRGLEPPPPKGPAPKAGVYTNFTTRA